MSRKSIEQVLRQIADDLLRLIVSPYAAFVFMLIFGGLGFSGKLSLDGTRICFVLAWLVGLYGLYLWRPSPLSYFALYSVIFTMGLIVLGFWVRPEAVPMYSGTIALERNVLFSTNDGVQGTLRKFEIGESGTIITVTGPEGQPFLRAISGSHMTIESIDGELKVSADMIDESGALLARLERNEWSVARQPVIWDRNYTRDAIEVINARGRVILQLRLLPDRIRIQGEWWTGDGRGYRFAGVPGGGRGSYGVPLSRANIPDEPKIEPLFKYPSESHLGELRVR